MADVSDGEQHRSRHEDFTLLQELGAGAWGRVHVGRRRQDGGLYAIKTVELAGLSRKDQLAAVSEAQVLSSLDSPHIVRYYDSFLHEGQLHIVMELCQGGSLHAAIRRARRPLPEDTIWRVLLHTALALHHMHSRRMLHRDVKTMNIFLSNPLDQQGRTAQRFKLGDVGVSKVLEEGRSHASSIIGTPFYLSPELVQELPYSYKSDIWALGVVLYECATRTHPFQAQSQASLILKILRGRYDPVLGLSTELTSIIHRCLSQAAARRPSAELLLSLPSVRAKAAELGIELPPGLGGVESSCEGRRGVPRPLSSQPQLLYHRRSTCQEAHPAHPLPERQPSGAALGVPGAQRSNSNSRAGGGAAMSAAAGEGSPRTSPKASPRPLLAGNVHVSSEPSPPAAGERRRPPLPPTGLPARRRASQAEPHRVTSPPSSPERPVSVAVAGPTTPQQAAMRPPPVAPPAAAVALPAHTQGSPTTPAAPLAGSGSAASRHISTSPRRHSHFSVEQHLQRLSGAAPDSLAQQRGSPGPNAGAAGEAAQQVQRSSKSDSDLLAMQKGAARGAANSPRLAQAEASEIALMMQQEPAPEESSDALPPNNSAMPKLLRAQCVALLGSEALFEEMHALARAAIEADGNSPRAGAGTLAALSDQLFERLGYSGHAAEALHLLLKILYYES